MHDPIITVRRARQLMALTGGFDRLLDCAAQILDEAITEAANSRPRDEPDVVATGHMARNLETAASRYRDNAIADCAHYLGRAYGCTQGGWHDPDFAWEVQHRLWFLSHALLAESDESACLDPWAAVAQIADLAHVWVLRWPPTADGA